MNQVAVNYPQSIEGRKALELYNTTLPQLQNKEFNLQELQTNIKLLYSYPSEEKDQALAVKEKIDKAVEELGYRKYSTSIDVYSVDTIFVTVHGFDSEPLAEGFAELLQVNKKYSLNMQPVVISSDNYRIVQLHKNLEVYKDLISNPKPQ